MKAQIRSYLPEDTNFLYNSWLKSFRESINCIENEIFFKNHTKLLDKILKVSEVFIACNPEDEDQIFGYVVRQKLGEISIIHYIYVKHTYRRLGFGNMMMDLFKAGQDIPHVTTHHTRMMDVVGEKWNLVFDPYLLLEL
jgi:ribosomal protein S18 acetylase RimI-like enzyme